MPDRHGPYRNSRFLLEIDDLIQAGFSQCTLPDTTTQVVEYREGADVAGTARKLAGATQYGNLTLQWGTTTDSINIFEWRQQVVDGDIDGARRQIAVLLLDEERNPGARWEFRDAWPVKYDAPDLNATANEVAIESIEIAHEGMNRVE